MVDFKIGDAKLISDYADVTPSAEIHASVAIWDLAQIKEFARIDVNVGIGRGAYLGPGVRIGANTRVQNFALIYEPAEIAEGVFIGPSAVLTNDLRPRAINPDGTQKSSDDWDAVGVRVSKGASIGARAVCVAPVTLGRWSMVAAGAVVISDVPDFALVAGVPARRIGWVGPAGYQLSEVPGSRNLWACPVTSATFKLVEPEILKECETQ